MSDTTPVVLQGDTVLCNFCNDKTTHYLQNLRDPSEPPVPICGKCRALSEPIVAPDKFSPN